MTAPTNAILDQASDQLGADLYRIATLYPPPAWVKTASEAQLKGTPELPRHVYADPYGRRYPTHTPAATWLSTAYFEEKRAAFEPQEAARIGRRLEGAVRYWGIAGDVAALRTKAAADHAAADAALGDDDFALVEVYDHGGRDRHLRLANPAEVKVAAAYFVAQRDEFGYPDRRTIARKILAKVAALGVVLEPGRAEPLEQAAGYGGCATKRAAAMVRDRAMLVRRSDEKLAHTLRQIAEAIEEPDSGTRDPDRLEKLATLIDQVDRQSGLWRQYSEGLERPEEVLFAVTTKVAADFLQDHVRATDGSLYRTADLGQLRVHDIRDHMGDEFADAISDDGIWPDQAKLAAVLPTCPRDDAELFGRLAAAAGVRPVGRDKEAAVPRGVNRAALLRLAAAGALDPAI